MQHGTCVFPQGERSQPCDTKRRMCQDPPARHPGHTHTGTDIGRAQLLTALSLAPSNFKLTFGEGRHRREGRGVMG
jgi:hypothetical protein